MEKITKENLMKSIVFFNNKGGVGKTTFTYHIGFALEQAGKKILFVDADPQCNLSSHLCDDAIISKEWGTNGNSIYKAVEPIVSGSGDINFVEPYKLGNRNIWIFVGDLLLSDFEMELTNAWTQLLAGMERGFRVTSAIYRIIMNFCQKENIDYVFIDIGPNMGALNRAILLGCDNYFIPVIPDMFSLRGTQNIGRTFATWISNFQYALERVTLSNFDCVCGTPQFSGYILQQFNKYRKRETKAFENWGDQIPNTIENYIVKPLTTPTLSKYNLVQKQTNYKIAEFKNYNSLIPLAQASQKPIFELTSKDGVVGGHIAYVKNCKKEFDEIAQNFLKAL